MHICMLKNLSDHRDWWGNRLLDKQRRNDKQDVRFPRQQQQRQIRQWKNRKYPNFSRNEVKQDQPYEKKRRIDQYKGKRACYSLSAWHLYTQLLFQKLRVIVWSLTASVLAQPSSMLRKAVLQFMINWTARQNIPLGKHNRVCILPLPNTFYWFLIATSFAL